MAKYWSESPHRCPKCSGRMIYNHMGHECSMGDCDYVESPEAVFDRAFRESGREDELDDLLNGKGDE